MRQYETAFLITPNLPEEDNEKIVSQMAEVVSKKKGNMINVDEWGKRRLAYPIQKKSTGFYYLLEFKSEGDLIEKLEVQYRRDERIIRFLTFKMEKFAVEYAEKKRRQKELGKSKEE